MPGRAIHALMVLAVVAASATLCAQTAKTFTVRVVDGKTGTAVIPDNIQVHINYLQATHVEWVKLADDGTAVVTVPSAATTVSVRATYENGMEYYINCDVAHQRDSSRETWYPLADVLAQGLAIPNECAKSKSAGDLKIEAKPGEFILLVRKHNLRDRAEEIR
jgi:hypothetical protein